MYVVTAPYPIDLASGRVLAPGEKVAKADVTDDPHDQRHLEEGRLKEESK
jgi:hypothetical protein